ncbi:MAG: DUF4238 domain-containing protein [Deltaproteobacteria bacterium]|nr:DUF4238 domain-containing protein [Candidatus Zymogenaceae bacterium]
MSNTKKKHHYVPVFYLEYFIDPYKGKDTLWVYDKEKEEIRKSTPLNEGYRKYYHAITLPDGTRDTNTLEDEFSVIESETKKFFNKICSTKELKKIRITDKERKIFSRFLGLTAVRTPHFRSGLEESCYEHMNMTNRIVAQDEKKYDKFKKSFEDDFGEIEGFPSFKEFKEFVVSGHELSLKSEDSLILGLKKAGYYSALFYMMNWTFIEANSEKFFTSDSPLFYKVPDRNSWSLDPERLKSQNVIATFPMTPSIAYRGELKGIAHFKTSNKVTRDLNFGTMVNTERFVYSSIKSERLLKYIVKHKGKRIKMYWPIECYELR